jgi:hypothetical protein
MVIAGWEARSWEAKDSIICTCCDFENTVSIFNLDKSALGDVKIALGDLKIAHVCMVVSLNIQSVSILPVTCFPASGDRCSKLVDNGSSKPPNFHG